VTRDLALIFNPTSGRGKAARLRPEIEARLAGLGCSVETLASRSASHATELAAAAAERHPAVVAMGGDGMVALVANGVLGSKAVFGIIPSGSGNDFAVNLGYLRHDPVAACAAVAAGSVRAVDVGRIAGRGAFLCVAGAGFDSEVNRAANEIRWARGTAVYVAATLKTLARFRPARFTLRTDGTTESFDGMFVAVGNAASYGGGMRITPNADLSDGLFDVCIVRAMKRRSLFVQLPRLFEGKHVDHPAVEIRRARDVELEADRPFSLYADGEDAGRLPVRLTIEPRALRVLVP
jgi:YegS/Rv2252/BmrU family lipid kinase